jgi:hypothetical protein
MRIHKREEIGSSHRQNLSSYIVTNSMEQKCLWRNVPAFISTEDWPSGSPDFNPRDYKLWAVLEDMACQQRHNNLHHLTRSLMKAAAEIPLETVHATIAE